MADMLVQSTFFGVIISLAAYAFGAVCQEKLKTPILNPLLISVVITIAVLKLTGIEYDTYRKGADFLNWLLTPATICLALPMYEKMALLKKTLPP